MRGFWFFASIAALSLSACSEGPLDAPDVIDKSIEAQEKFFKASEGRWLAKFDNDENYEVFISGGRMIISALEESSNEGRIIGFYPETMTSGESVNVGFDEKSGTFAKAEKLEFISKGDSLAINLDGLSASLERIKPSSAKDEVANKS